MQAHKHSQTRLTQSVKWACLNIILLQLLRQIYLRKSPPLHKEEPHSVKNSLFLILSCYSPFLFVHKLLAISNSTSTLLYVLSTTLNALTQTLIQCAANTSSFTPLGLIVVLYATRLKTQIKSQRAILFFLFKKLLFFKCIHIF